MKRKAPFELPDRDEDLSNSQFEGNNDQNAVISTPEEISQRRFLKIRGPKLGDQPGETAQAEASNKNQNVKFVLNEALTNTTEPTNTSNVNQQINFLAQFQNQNQQQQQQQQQSLFSSNNNNQQNQQQNNVSEVKQKDNDQPKSLFTNNVSQANNNAAATITSQKQQFTIFAQAEGQSLFSNNKTVNQQKDSSEKKSEEKQTSEIKQQQQDTTNDLQKKYEEKKLEEKNQDTKQSLFGPTSGNNNNSNQSGGLFQQKSGGSGGLFANTNQQQQPPSLFSAGGLFGNNNNSDQNKNNLFNMFANNNASTGANNNPLANIQPITVNKSIFDNPNQQQNKPLFGNNTGGGLFGNMNQQNTSSLFGNPQNTSSLFSGGQLPATWKLPPAPAQQQKNQNDDDEGGDDGEEGGDENVQDNEPEADPSKSTHHYEYESITEKLITKSVVKFKIGEKEALDSGVVYFEKVKDKDIFYIIYRNNVKILIYQGQVYKNINLSNFNKKQDCLQFYSYEEKKYQKEEKDSNQQLKFEEMFDQRLTKIMFNSVTDCQEFQKKLEEVLKK